MFCLLFLLFVTVTSDQPCKDSLSVDITEGKTFSPDGKIVFDGAAYDTDYIYSKNVSGELKTFGCLCKFKKCFRKCCPKGSVMNMTTRHCSVSELLDIILNNGLDLYFLSGFRNNVGVNEQEIGFLYGKPEEDMYMEDETWHLQEDGQLYIEIPNGIPPYTLREPDKYCIDTFVYTDSDGNQKTQLDALVCYAEVPFDELPKYIVTSTCMIISCVFILATVAVYSWLPELRNLHGKVLMAYLLCLFVAFLLFATMQILLIFESINSNYCKVLTFIIYFFLLSSFFWLNVMSFDIWWTFSGNRGLSLEKLSTRARFCAYAAYSFGVPTILTAIMLGLETSGLPAHYLMPNLDMYGCFLSGTSKLIYLYGPIVVLCVANMIFFILTAMKIAHIKSQTSKALKGKDSTTHDQDRNNQQRLFLYVKLFVVMGINWLLEVVSALYPAANSVWWITDAYNVLIGLIIFIIFVCKRKIFRLMKNRYKQMRGEPMSRTVTTSTRTSCSRDDIRMSVRNVSSNSAGP